MRIISKFHDYYDVGQRTGMDRSVVFVRNTTEVKPDDTPHCCYFPEGRSDQPEFEVVGFCGQLVPMVVFSKSRYDNEDYKSAFTIDQVPDDIDKGRDKIRRFLSITHFEFPRFPMFRHDNNRHLDHLRLSDLFQHFKVPLFYICADYYRSRLILNPCLKELGFYRFVDPITAYQEVYRFVANDLADVKEVDVNLPNDVMAASKGFGHKYAFRQEPGTKQRKGHPK